MQEYPPSASGHTPMPDTALEPHWRVARSDSAFWSKSNFQTRTRPSRPPETRSEFDSEKATAVTPPPSKSPCCIRERERAKATAVTETTAVTERQDNRRQTAVTPLASQSACLSSIPGPQLVRCLVPCLHLVPPFFPLSLSLSLSLSHSLSLSLTNTHQQAHIHLGLHGLNVRLQKFSKISALVYALLKLTTEDIVE